tara:strand:+ start:254 stop:3694 length:3441 start_codon:yes stop_codon:yes gene_type:complete
MGVEAYTDAISIGSSARCYIDNENPTTPYAGSTRVEQEDLVDSGVDTAEVISPTETDWTTDNGDVTDDFSEGDIIFVKADGSSTISANNTSYYVSGSGVIMDPVERGYDGTTTASGDLPTNADIYKSRLNTCVTLCTFTIAEPATHGITKDAIVKDIKLNYGITGHTGTLFFALLSGDFSPTNATWRTSDGSSTWNPRFLGGSKGTEKIYKAFVSEATGPSVSLKTFVEAYDLTWGSKVNLAIYHNPTSNPTTSPAAALTSFSLNYQVLYEDPAPLPPQIEIEANDDGLTWWDQRSGSYQTANINVINGLDDADLAKIYLTTLNSVSNGNVTETPAYNDNSGPHLTTTELGRRTFNTKELSNTGLFSDGTRDGESRNWYYRMWIEDANNTTTNAISSNLVKAVRPQIVAAATYNKEGTATSSFEVGDKVELKVTVDTSSAGNQHHGQGPAQGKIKKVYVNWNGMPSACMKPDGSSSNRTILNADLPATQNYLQVNQDHGLDGYIYEAGLNEVYIVIASTSTDNPTIPENLEIVKIVEEKSGGTDQQYTITRGLFGTSDIAHESTSSELYVYSPASVPQKSLFNVGNVESIDNYVEYELSSPSSTTEGVVTLTHRYGVDEEYPTTRSSDGTDGYLERPTIRVVVEDEYGWRSDAESVIVTNTAIPPEASISASRGETALASTAGDRDSAVVLSGTNSRAFGGGKSIKQYKWSCTQAAAADIVTSGVLDINNEPLEPASRKLWARCSKSGYTDAVITVVGLGSFDANGTSINDDDAGFNDGYYKYVKATVKPGDTGYTTAAGAGSSWHAEAANDGSQDIYFKQVDFAYVTTVDSTASASEIYQIFSSDSDGTEPTAHDKSRCVVPKLCVDTDQNIWGGLTSIAATAPSGGTTGYGARIKADSSNQRFESHSTGGHENFIQDGFAPGDFIIVKGGFTAANQGMYLVDKVEESSGEYHMYVDTSFKKIDSTETVTNFVKKEIYATRPSISVACESDAIETFNLIAMDDKDTDSTAATVSIPFRVPASLNLDTIHDSGSIAIQAVKITRANTLNANMPVGMRRYPVGAVHTKYGLPTLAMSVRVMDDTGFAAITQLIDNRYNYATFAYKKTSDTTYVTYKLKLQSWSLDKKPEQGGDEMYSLNFVISGESV